MKDSCQNTDAISREEIPIMPQEYNEILNLQQTIFEMLASGSKSDDILATLCFLAEKLLPNSVASIMLLNDKDGLISVLSAPSIPVSGHEVLKNLKPGSGGGSCANAIFTNEAQFVQNTFEDSRWFDFKQVAIDFNIRSCWSMPIRNENKKPIGTFALSLFEHSVPTNFHKKLLEIASYIVNIVLKNRANEQKIELFSLATNNAAEGMVITDQDNKIVEVNQAFYDIYGYIENEVIGFPPKYFIIY